MPKKKTKKRKKLRKNREEKQFYNKEKLLKFLININ